MQKIWPLMASASAAALFWSTAAVAQDDSDDAGAAAENSSRSNVIIVTATRREETLQDVPVAVSVVSGELLDSTGVGGVDQITEAVPSVTFTRGNNESNSSLSVRGIGTSVFSAAVEPSVSVIFDDVVLARSGQGFQDFIDVERVEVLRGPQSTLFGKNASAGVVSVTTKAPTDYLSGQFDALYAEDNEYQVRGSLSGPISDDLGIRVSGFARGFDGLTTNAFNGKHANGYDSWGLRGKLQFEPSSNVTIKLIGDFRDYSASPTFVVRGTENPNYAALFDPVEPVEGNVDINVNAHPTSESEQGGAQLNADIKFGNDFTLTSISAWRYWDFMNNIDVDATPLSVGQPASGLPFTWDVNTGRTHLDQYSQEFRLASPDLGGFDFLIGALAYRLDLDRAFERRWVFAAAARSATFDGSTSTTNLAAFANTNIYLGDLTLFGGVRIINEKLEWDIFRDPANVLVPGDLPLFGAIGTFADFSGSVSDTALAGNIGAEYDFGSGNVYATYSRGYKGAGFDVAFGAVETFEPLAAETVDAFELGLKMESDDGVFAVNLATFYTMYDNYQAQVVLNTEVLLQNAGSISTKGIEIEGTIKPTDLLDIRLGATLMDARIDEFTNATCYLGQTEAEGCVGGVQDLSGADLPNAPDLRLTFFARQIVPFGDSSAIDGFVQFNGTYQSSVQWRLDQDPRTIQGGYAKVNAAVGIESKDKDYSISLFVRNLFNQREYASIDYTMTGGGRFLGQVPRDFGRYFGIRGNFSF